MKKLFTSESVTEGHPDKICDQISDAVLDAILAQDPYARVACETCTTTGIVMVMGEVTTTADYRVDDIVREVVCDIGYDRAKYGFDGHTCAVLTALHGQSPDIAMGVDDALEGRGVGDMDIGAGDQGMMFGFACDETPEMMPMPIALAHRITRRLSEARRNGELTWLRRMEKARLPSNTTETRLCALIRSSFPLSMHRKPAMRNSLPRSLTKSSAKLSPQN